MKKSCMVSIALLFIWFSMDMTGFSIGNVTLVEAAWNSIDGVWGLIFLFLSILFIIKDTIEKHPLTLFIFVWLVSQYFSHWHYTLFGASDKKINAYNQFFSETYHIIPPSHTVVIPDFYHIVLHIFILSTLSCLTVFCVYNRKSVPRNI